MGPIYGQQFRAWTAFEEENDAESNREYRKTSIDQIEQTLHLLRNDPDSRRIVVSAWNVADLGKMALSPCHALFQFFTRELTFRERLITTEQPGWGNPFKKTGAQGFEDSDWALENSGPVGDYLDNLGVPRRGLSCKLYQRSADMFLGVPFNIASYALLTHMVAQQVGMVPLEFIWSGGDCHIYSNHVKQMTEQVSRKPFPLPRLELRKAEDLYSYTPQDVQFINYQHHPALRGDVAV